MAHFTLLLSFLLPFVLIESSRALEPCNGSDCFIGFPPPGFQGLEQKALGVENGDIPDASLSASSSWSNSVTNYGPLRGRLNTAQSGSMAGAWVPNAADTEPWIQATLNGVTVVIAVGTQGRAAPNTDQRVTSYEIGCSLDGVNFLKISRHGGQCITTSFTGNNDQESVVINQLTTPYLCRHVRVYPLTHAVTIKGMRFEVYGY